MAKKQKTAKPHKRPIEQYDHKGKKRVNNPPVGLVTPQTDPILPTHKTYGYRSASLRARWNRNPRG